ncbi:MAG TPA: phosphoribosylformylglycinamidine synthase subunit PurQ [Thermoanaerobacterales bacterium]|nr:phosphoribosylformylglycinamidine synthase subunit PurQ [Thermoanaerobacterales bacterium]
MKFGIIVFPGSSGEGDCFHVLKNLFNQDVDYIWHKDSTVNMERYSCIILPGGASYGDYIRPGSIAGNSPIIEKLRIFADNGGLVLGICNGFQILLESGLLPGALIQNEDLKFKCQHTFIRAENTKTPFTSSCIEKQTIRVAMAHGYGRYYAPENIISELKKNGQIIFRYCDKDGNINKETNPNGSEEDIAGITNKQGNILGLMVHPERSCEEILGSSQGKIIFDSILRHIEGVIQNDM